MELKRVLFLTCLVFMFSNVSALNLTNNTSWVSIMEIPDANYPEEIIGEDNIFLDINNELLSIIVKSFDVDYNLISTMIDTNISINTYKNVKDSFLINDDIGFYYDSVQGVLLMTLEGEEFVFELLAQ